MTLHENTFDALLRESPKIEHLLDDQHARGSRLVYPRKAHLVSMFGILWYNSAIGMETTQRVRETPRTGTILRSVYRRDPCLCAPFLSPT